MAPAPSAPRRQAAPWTVVTQGSDVSYTHATLLDKLEYVVRVAPARAAVDRTLAQDGFIGGVTTALSGVAASVTNPEVLCRAADLLSAVVAHAGASGAGGAAAGAQVVGALGGAHAAPFIACVRGERGVAARFAAPLGALLALKAGVGSAARAAPAAAFSEAMVDLLAAVGAEAAKEHAEAAEQGEVRVAYVPGVSGMEMPAGVATESDVQLGRVLSGVAAFLVQEENRLAFCKAVGGDGEPAAKVLTSLIGRVAGLPVQAVYQTVFCLWLLSFPRQTPYVGEDVADEGAAAVASALEDAAVPRHLTAVLREVHAEKVVRISLAALRNLMAMSTVLRKEMVGAGLVAALQGLCFRRWNDDDITEDLRVLAESLEAELAHMTTFDVYRHEVLSGALEWTPAHRDDMFWRDNVEKLESNNHEVLRCMVRLLEQSDDTTVLSVACHDLAQFIKYHPRGRLIAQSLNVKGRLMQLMTDGDVEVRRYALNTVQVLMISNWNLMQRVS